MERQRARIAQLEQELFDALQKVKGLEHGLQARGEDAQALEAELHRTEKRLMALLDKHVELVW